ncbi:RadC family protein [Tenacibaculum sp. M341]|uniref:RadC family protein n=1 Tax=Tenacibaculum sp. M341 TaxID=2530339 RepID=UPI0010477756|nr:DNA repair protein RadC [Tenacibaculum sp. M341]TCI85351.1 JAB domain-containing protein [Tenacibaculum sp. M341]
MKKLSIKSWALDDRPREKMLFKGQTSLSDAELIAILIGSGNRDESAVALSKRILGSVNNNLHQLSKLSINELMHFKGVGEAKAISIITALELGKRRHFEHIPNAEKIKSSKDAFLIMQPFLSDLQHEEFWVVYLNNANKVLSKKQISKGGLNSTLVDVRLIFKKALELLAVGVILYHNHPSGKLSPSLSDKQLTQKIKEAGASLDIKVLDHLIITEKTYFSFADESIL